MTHSNWFYVHIALAVLNGFIFLRVGGAFVLLVSAFNLFAAYLRYVADKYENSENDPKA